MSSPDLLAIEEAVGGLCRSRLPLSTLWDLDDHKQYPHGPMSELASAGWAAAAIPEEYGGSGASIDALVAIHRALARHNLAIGQAYFSLWVLAADLLARHGTTAQKETWLPAIAGGTARIGFAMTEPASGSDAAAVKTVARPTDDGFELSGQKVFITGAAVSDALVVMARTEPGSTRHHGLSLLIVDPDAPGVTIRKLSKIGLHMIDLCEVFFDGVRVPSESVIGRLGDGWAHTREGLAKERTLLGAICVGAMQDLIEQCVEYSKEREAFGTSIGKFQMIGAKIVDMEVQAAAANALVEQAAAAADADAAPVIEASMAKLFASEAYIAATRDAVQIFGGYGFTDEYAVGRHYRDAKYLEIGGGSSEIQRLIIGRSMGLM